MRMKRAVWTVLAAGFLVVGCDKSDSPQPKRSGPSPAATLTVGSVGHDHQLALYVAALHGERFRKDYGVYLKEIKAREIYDLMEAGQVRARLKHVKVGGGARMPAAMSRGEIQIGLGGVPAVAKYADKGEPFRIIAPLQADGDMPVMKADSPVTSWADFVRVARSGAKPIKIGYKAPVAVAKLVFVGALKAEGIPHSDAGPPAGRAGVHLINLMTEKSPFPLLASGSIDGFVWNQPPVAVAVHKKVGKVVGELRDLPPKGRWAYHPCCCVSATDETLRKHPGAVKAFLKVILLSTQLIRAEQDLAIDAASKWTKNPPQVEALSIPTITYVAEPTEAWREGMETWLALMQGIHAFKGEYADATAKEFLDDVLRLDLVRQAAAELREKKLLRP